MGADPVISAEDEEQRLRQRLKQRQMERKKTATEVSTLDHNRVEKVNSVDKTTEISVKDSGTSSSSKNLESAPPSDSPSKRNTGKNIPEGIKSTGTKPSDDKKSELEIEEKGATNGKCEGSRRPRSPDKNVSAKMADSSDGKHEGSRRSRSPDKNASTKAADNTNGKREGSRRSRSPDKNDSTKTADSTKGKREGSRRSRSPDKNASVKTADSTNGKREGRRRSRSPEKNVSTKSADSTKGKREGSKRSRSPDKNGSVKGADSNDDKKGDELTPKRRRRRRRRGGRRRRDRRRMREMERDWHRGDNRDGFGPPGPMRGGFPPGRRGDIPPPGYGRPPDFRGGFPRDFNDRGPPNDRMSEEEFRRRREFERRERERWERNFPGRDRQRDESERFRDRDRDRMRDRDRDRDKNRDRDRDRSRDRDKVDKDRDRSRGRGKDSSRRRSLSCSRSDSGSSSGSDSRSRSGSRSSSRGRRKSSSGKKDDASTDKKAGTESIEIKNVLEVDEGDKALDGALTKDQRTVFVSQLVMRADEGDIRGFFERKARCRVNDVILLRDRRTGRHKGCAYVELGRLSDVQRAVTTDSTVPDFQRFPILVRASEAEKNYEAALGNAVLMGTAAAGFGAAGSDLSNIAALAGGLTTSAMLNLSVPGIASNKKSEAQNVYVGSIDRCVTQAQLYALFSQFGVLDKVALQMDTTTGMSRGFAFLSYRDSRDANLAIQTMSGQKLAGRALKTGWANQPSAPGVQILTSDDFPEDSASRIQKAHLVLTQLTGSGLMAMASLGLATGAAETTASSPLYQVPQATSSAQIASAAEAAVNAALGLPQEPDASVPVTESDPKEVKGSLSKNILVHNVFNKDEETEEGWEEDIKEDFEEECTKYGAIEKVVVLHEKVGGMIYVSFKDESMATACAAALAGRWFDKKQLRVEYVEKEPEM